MTPGVFPEPSAARGAAAAFDLADRRIQHLLQLAQESARGPAAKGVDAALQHGAQALTHAGCRAGSSGFIPASICFNIHSCWRSTGGRQSLISFENR